MAEHPFLQSTLEGLRRTLAKPRLHAHSRAHAQHWLNKLGPKPDDPERPGLTLQELHERLATRRAKSSAAAPNLPVPQSSNPAGPGQR
jgi:hypothetical protein